MASLYCFGRRQNISRVSLLCSWTMAQEWWPSLVCVLPFAIAVWVEKSQLSKGSFFQLASQLSSNVSILIIFASLPPHVQVDVYRNAKHSGTKKKGELESISASCLKLSRERLLKLIPCKISEQRKVIWFGRVLEWVWGNVLEAEPNKAFTIRRILFLLSSPLCTRGNSSWMVHSELRHIQLNI